LRAARKTIGENYTGFCFYANQNGSTQKPRVKITAAFYFALAVGIIFAFGKTGASGAKICIDFMLFFGYFNIG
jgi:hypothetical protein